MILEIVAVREHGSVAVGYGRDDRGREAAIAIEPRMAADIANAIEAGEHPEVAVEEWQLLSALPIQGGAQ